MDLNWKIEREWVYRDIKPRIIAEKLMENEDGSQIVDWKLFCFNGEPKLLFYASDRYSKDEPLKFDWYDIKLRHLPIHSKGYPNANKRLELFPEWETMKEVARALSKGIPHVRVDFFPRWRDGTYFPGRMGLYNRKLAHTPTSNLLITSQPELL